MGLIVDATDVIDIVDCLILLETTVRGSGSCKLLILVKQGNLR